MNIEKNETNKESAPLNNAVHRQNTVKFFRKIQTFSVCLSNSKQEKKKQRKYTRKRVK